MGKNLSDWCSIVTLHSSNLAYALNPFPTAFPQVISVDPTSAPLIRAELLAIRNLHRCRHIVRSFEAFFVDGVCGGSPLHTIHGLFCRHSIGLVTEAVNKNRMRPNIREVVSKACFFFFFGAKRSPLIVQKIFPRGVLKNKKPPSKKKLLLMGGCKPSQWILKSQREGS